LELENKVIRTVQPNTVQRVQLGLLQ